ncbi:hypothetical protein KRP22_006619 [Phytophthora ramorum]|nr:hypothetical protein KRP22_2252 [Phytophthora ramorum]
MTQQDARRLDGVLPTALEGLQQRRETIKNLREIDKLLRDDLDESLATTSRPSSTRGCSFGSARNPARNPRYWLAKSSSAPGPGAYVASKADGLIKPKRFICSVANSVEQDKTRTAMPELDGNCQERACFA